MISLDEHVTSITDRPAWLKVSAPRLAARINHGTYVGLELSHAWSCMHRDYQSATWALLDDAARERVKAVRS